MHSEPLLSIRGITKDYHVKSRTIKALKGVSLDIFKGEILSLLGVNGAGKTTLSNIIGTLHPPTSGTILYQEESIYDNLYSYRMKLGICPQKPNLNPYLTLEDNLLFAGRFYGMSEREVIPRVKELMEQYNLTQYAQESVHVLSGGYKQRFMIARALVHNPSLIIFDEPTVALDPHIRHELWEHIKALKDQGVSVLLTTHYIDEAEVLSDRICILDKGIVKLIDTPSNLMKQFSHDRLEKVFIELMKEQEVKTHVK